MSKTKINKRKKRRRRRRRRRKKRRKRRAREEGQSRIMDDCKGQRSAEPNGSGRSRCYWLVPSLELMAERFFYYSLIYLIFTVL
jgi:hypothetical protein